MPHGMGHHREVRFDKKGSGTAESNVPLGIASEPSTGNLYVVEGATILAGANDHGKALPAAGVSE